MERDGNLNFFDLPIEMRLKILGYVHAEESNSENWKTWNNKRLVCRQMKNDIDNEFGVFVSWSSDCPHQHREIPKLTSKVCRFTMKCNSKWMESFPSLSDFFRQNAQSMRKLSWKFDCPNVVLSELLQLTLTCANLKKLLIEVLSFDLLPLGEKNGAAGEVLFPKLTSLELCSVDSGDPTIFYLMRTLLLPNISHFELKMFGDSCHEHLNMVAFRNLFGFLQKHSNSMRSLNFFIDVDGNSQNENESNLKELFECVDNVKDKLFLRSVHIRFSNNYDILNRSIFGKALIKFIMQQAPTLTELTLWTYDLPANVYFPNLRRLHLFLVTNYNGFDCNVVVNLFPNLQDLSLHGHCRAMFQLRNCQVLPQLRHLKRLLLHDIFMPETGWRELKAITDQLNLDKVTVLIFSASPLRFEKRTEPPNGLFPVEYYYDCYWLDRF